MSVYWHRIGVCECDGRDCILMDYKLGVSFRTGRL